MQSKLRCHVSFSSDAEWGTDEFQISARVIVVMMSRDQSRHLPSYISLNVPRTRC